MRTELKDEIVVAIRTRIKEVKVEISQLEVSATPVSPDNAIGRLTRMDAIVGQGVSKTALIQARVHLDRLKNALVRSDRDGFGECDTCLKPIPVARLLAMPDASRCVSCQQKSETD